MQPWPSCLSCLTKLITTKLATIKCSANSSETTQANKKIILQKYIEKPLLILQRKFDIRMWVLLTYDLNILLFTEGYLRLSSENYDLQSSDQFIHLTNNAIQKFSQNSSKFEEGNQLSFSNFKEFLNKSDVTSFSAIYSKIQNYILISLNSTLEKISSYLRKFQFEIFGYDFILDENYNLWLLEVNTNPCIETSSTLLSKLIPRMLGDAFKLTIDKHFPPPPNAKYTCNFSVDGYNDDENLWILLDRKTVAPFVK
eukprot:TRINITY_DN4994_c0_g1_i3.p1 TRINITY_DN4994_c0_g1~~TRINITY_DN4994_c0_g1_i3.p1  ORF type:complete len:255 (-),score=34.02 TRINITY_DN4994_c0_g1_i3:60-824(-)